MFETKQVFTQSNTAVITNDNVVKYRCMVNGVPVIHTGSGKTTWICYAKQGDEINKAFVKTWLKELVSHNNSVINIIDAPGLRDFVNTVRPGTQLGICCQRCHTMPGHFNFRNNGYLPCLSIGNHLFNLFLSIKPTVFFSIKLITFRNSTIFIYSLSNKCFFSFLS